MGRKAQFQEAWALNGQMNQRLIEAISTAGLDATYAPRTRTVRRVWVHMHNMRLHWLDALAANPTQVKRLKSREAHDPATLQAALAESQAAIADWLKTIVKKDQIKVIEHSPTSFLAFMIAHEAHHRGQIIVALRLAGHALPREATLGIWDH